MAGPDYIVDIDGLRQPDDDGATQASASKNFRGWPWLAIRWQCCSTYSRIYRNSTGEAYEGRCPRCSRLIKVPIGPSGTHTRFFDAT